MQSCLKSSLRPSSRPLQRSAERNVAVKAQTPMQKLMETFANGAGEISRGDKLTKPGEGKVKAAWKYDAAMSRWVKVAKPKEEWDTSMELPTITTASGDTYTIWPAIWTYLTEKRLKSIEVEEAYNMIESGKAVLVDVRKASSFAKQHAVGSINVPLFGPVTKDDRWSKIKKTVVGLLAMEATERNANFREDAKRLLPKNKTIIVCCDLGGTLETEVWGPDRRKVCKTDPDRAFGRESRSLKACFELYEAGFTKIVHLKGGYPQWRFDGYPLE